MEKKTVYLETSVVSYLTNRPSRDIIVAGHQLSTREWWETQRASFDVYVSELVIPRQVVAMKRPHKSASPSSMGLSC